MSSFVADDAPGMAVARLSGLSIRRLVQILFATLTALAVIAAIAISLAASRRRDLVSIERRQLDAYRLGIELRETSDGLTRLARSYAATGDERFERFYHEAVGIRDGTVARPVRYGLIFWDRAIAGDSTAARGPPVATLELMRRNGLTSPELEVLRLAESRSESLVVTETAAFRAVKQGDRPLALRLLFSPEYHRQKAAIMAPIDSFLTLSTRQAQGELDAFAAQTRRSFWMIEALFLVFIVAVAASYPLLRARVLNPVALLQEQTRSLARDIDKLASVSTDIAAGDLGRSFVTATPQIASARGDEIGELSRLHDSMVGRLENTGAAISKMTVNLRQANDVLNKHVEEVDLARHYLETILETSKPLRSQWRLSSTGSLASRIGAAASFWEAGLAERPGRHGRVRTNERACFGNWKVTASCAT
jgi:hypothetical protein